MKHTPIPIVVWLLAASAALGQTTPPAAPPSAPAASSADSEETLKLSPFVVSENDAVGYSAASTLVGTRINTALRDVGAAISIITPEFLTDTAAAKRRGAESAREKETAAWPPEKTARDWKPGAVKYKPTGGKKGGGIFGL